MTCLSCGADQLAVFLSLGKTPLANSLLTAEQLNEPEAVYPLDVADCPRCWMVQLAETVPPEKMFSEYLYFSSFSDAMLAHSKAIVERMVVTGLSEKSPALEVTSNGGYLDRPASGIFKATKKVVWASRPHKAMVKMLGSIRAPWIDSHEMRIQDPRRDPRHSISPKRIS